MKNSSLLSLFALLSFSTTSLAGKGGTSYQVFDNHPTGGPGATGKVLEFPIGDSAYKVVDGRLGPCGHRYLAGFAFGHPNPQDADPKAVCGHGYVTIVGPPSTAPTPVSILPIQAPMPMEPGGSAIVDAARFIREMLPRLDKIDGDKLPGIVQLRESIQRIDARNGSRTIPLRQTPGREQGK